MSSRILLADDSYTVRAYTGKLLVQHGYQVVLATDGMEAVNVVRSATPDLALLDINMPGLDGYGVCEELRQLGLLDFPIVFLTSVRANAVKMLGNEMGAYLPKPVKDELLIGTVREMLGGVRISETV